MAEATENNTEPLLERPNLEAEASTLPSSPLTPKGRSRPNHISFSSLSPRSRRCSPRNVEFPRFLDACSQCKKPLGANLDIFMYRGDTPFCSEECRQERIDMDEMKDRKWSNLAMKALARKEQTKESIHVRATGTVVAG